MKAIQTSTHLAECLGMNMLTGEACAYSMRILFDLNKDGADLVRDFFGIPPGSPLAPNWNSTVGTLPAMSSIMLPRSVLPDLVRFALFRQYYDYVLQDETGWGATGITQSEVDTSAPIRLVIEGSMPWMGRRLYRNYAMQSKAPMAGSRNIHAFTGRGV